MDDQAGRRITGPIEGPRRLDPGDYYCDPDGWWWIRPPEPGYLVGLNRDTYTVTDHADGTITVEPAIEQETGLWRLTAGQWTRVMSPVEDDALIDETVEEPEIE